MDNNNEWDIDYDENDLDLGNDSSNLDSDIDSDNNDNINDLNNDRDSNQINDDISDELSDDERLINMWVEKEYLLINPEEDEIGSIEDAFKIDAKRRTDFIREKLIDSFPDEFKMLAEGVINHGITDIKKILELMEHKDPNAQRELDDDYAAEIVKKHYSDIGWDEEDIEMDIKDRKAKNKLIGMAQRVLERQNEIEDKTRKIQMEREIERQKLEEETNRKKQQDHQDQLVNQFKQKAWREDTKKQIAEEYFKGTTIEKTKHLLHSPETAADFAMIVSRIFKTDPQGNVSLDMNSLVDLVKTKEVKKIKNELSQKAFSNKIRFGNAQRQSQSEDIDMSEYDFTNY